LFGTGAKQSGKQNPITAIASHCKSTSIEGIAWFVNAVVCVFHFVDFIA
jgi:hypothetical protein